MCRIPLKRRPNPLPSNPPTDLRAEQGRQAEQRALAYLEAQGLHLIARNYRCRGGEIDLVMRDRVHLVMVEVRYRRRTSYVKAAASVDLRKQRRLIWATRHYLAMHPQAADQPVRFDVLALDGPIDAPDIEWLRNAFEAHDF